MGTFGWQGCTSHLPQIQYQVSVCGSNAQRWARAKWNAIWDLRSGALSNLMLLSHIEQQEGIRCCSALCKDIRDVQWASAFLMRRPCVCLAHTRFVDDTGHALFIFPFQSAHVREGHWSYSLAEHAESARLAPTTWPDKPTSLFHPLLPSFLPLSLQFLLIYSSPCRSSECRFMTGKT